MFTVHVFHVVEKHGDMLESLVHVHVYEVHVYII